MDEIIKRLQQEVECIDFTYDGEHAQGYMDGIMWCIGYLKQYINSHMLSNSALTQYPPADGEVLEIVGDS